VWFQEVAKNVTFAEKMGFGGLWEPGSPNGGTQENCATTFIARSSKKIY